MIGILQHPDIRTNRQGASFDVLIVDEASKVTFSDFIIPALHAKKWILVGDVKQLSPYVENDYVSENIASMLGEAQQQAIVKQFELKIKLADKRFDDCLKIFFTGIDIDNEFQSIKSEYPNLHILKVGKQTADLNKIQTNWKKDFQSKALKTANIKDLKELEVFKDGKLIKKILLDDNKEEKRKIFKVSDLISFFNQKPEIKDNSTKSLKIKLKAEIESLQKDIRANGTDKFEVIEITEEKDKKTKVVVIKDSFSPNDIQQLNDLKELKIYIVPT
jgi:hypothetical protein